MGREVDSDTTFHLSRDERAKVARRINNQTIPTILKANPRARGGVDAAELIVDPAPAKIVNRKEGATTSAVTAEGQQNVGPVDGLLQSGNVAQAEGSYPPMPPVRLWTTDTLAAAHRLTVHDTNLPSHRRPRIAILNMASPLRPGGGVLSGATSQEESLCRRTTLYPSLRDEFYRLPEVGGVYTPDVLVFHLRDDDGESADQAAKPDDRKDWFFVDVITAAMLRFPDVVGDGDEKRYGEEKDRELAVRKMVAVMRILKSKGAGKVVLGAWGCGAYGNPVGEIARAWRRVLLGKKTKGNVKRDARNEWEGMEVVFAIKDGRMADVFAIAFGDGLMRDGDSPIVPDSGMEDGPQEAAKLEG